MTDLLELVWDGRAASRSACDGILAVLLKQTLNDRLPRFLPPGTKVAHKTGTLGGTRNDAGILYIGDDDPVALTVFTRWDHRAVEGDAPAERRRQFEIDTAFGHIARAVYDYYAAG